MSKTPSRIAAIVLLTVFALLLAGEFRAAPTTPVPSASRPHAFVPTPVEIPSSDVVQPPTF